ncbi:MAG: GNAT family N-acetyltransferase [Chloroflexi bacterium]|nr:MAG: GNAT family N-acetyltransferase [Chloroflexota bacterium]
MLAQRIANPPATLQRAAIDDPRWTAFIASQPDATLFHHPAWVQALAEAYGYDPFLIIHADEDGNIVAGMPVLDVRSALRGRRRISLPFTDYCPPLARNAQRLTFFAEELNRWQIDAQSSIEVHGALPDIGGVDRVQVGFGHLLSLEQDPARLFSRLHPNIRRWIRKSLREGLTVRLGTSPADLEPFYRLHWQTRRRLGVPLQPRSFFDSLWRRVIEPGFGFVAFAYFGERPIAADLFLAWNGTLIGKFNASDRQFWSLRPNNLVVWAGIEWGCQNGYRLLDFGKTDRHGGGLRNFKMSWGSTEVPIFYSYLGGPAPSPLDGLASRVLTRVIQASPPVVCRVAGELLYRQCA